tara:strand:+ start:553 stop:756 length:204 start_codon:yes stop_codon:yes gene_type:complete
LDNIEKNLANSISKRPKKIPMMMDKARTIIVRRVASCLEGHVTFFSSPITSVKKEIGAKPFFEILGG